MTVSYNPERDLNEKWKTTVHDWITINGEILIIIRYLHAAGQKDWILVNSFNSLMDIIKVLPVGADVMANKYFEIKYRGIVTNNIIEAAKTLFEFDKEYLIIGLNRKVLDPFKISGTDGMGTQSLIDDLEDFINENIVMGICPNYSAADNDEMISFSKGGIDGAR